MNKEFVPYNEALELKQLGFDKPCFGWYLLAEDEEKQMLVPEKCPKQEIGLCLAPTYSQGLRFFRENGYDVKVEKESAGVYFGFWWTGVAWSLIESGTYEEAELACLRKLIEIVKNK